MNDDLEAAIAQLDTLHEILAAEIAGANECSEMITNWLAAGRELQAGVQKLRENMQRTSDRWDKVREALLERLEEETDGADWWK